VILVPSAVSLVWFAVLGGSAIFEQQRGVELAGRATPESQLFALLGEFPLAAVSGVVVMVLVAIFFVSGADAASIVMGTLSQRGTIRPSKSVVVFWGVVMGAVAVVMLLAGGADALTGLQNLTIIAALPFMVVMVGLCVSLARDLRSDPMILRQERAAEVMEEISTRLEPGQVTQEKVVRAAAGVVGTDDT
jgi:choline-glycine betaine transporter